MKRAEIDAERSWREEEVMKILTSEKMKILIKHSKYEPEFFLCGKATLDI